MAVEPQPSDQEITGPARAGRVARDDGDESAGAAHTSALVAVAASGPATGCATASRPTR
jgi:hypothetical protein